MAKKKEPINQRLIHIKAESPFMSSFELVPESKAVKRLEQIRDNFIYMLSRHRGRGGDEPKLTVKTCVHNPELF